MLQLGAVSNSKIILRTIITKMDVFKLTNSNSDSVRRSLDLRVYEDGVIMREGGEQRKEH